MKQLCVSCFVIDYENRKVLLINNPEDNTWIKPGDIIILNESPIDAAVRSVKEKTGVECNIVNTLFEQDYISPIDVRTYNTKYGEVLDIQYLALPINSEINSSLLHSAWFDIKELNKMDNVDEEVVYKTNVLFKLFKNDKKILGRTK